MTVEEVRVRLLAAGWNMLHQTTEIVTFQEPGSSHLLTLAGIREAQVPEATLNDILWTAGVL